MRSHQLNNFSNLLLKKFSTKQPKVSKTNINSVQIFNYWL